MAQTPYHFSPIELWIQDVLRLPPHPQPPEGSPESTHVLHAGRNYYKLCLIVWFLSHFLVLTALLSLTSIASKAIPTMPEWAAISVRVLESLVFVAFTVSAVLTFFSHRLNYVLRWYMVTDRSLRIRSGVFNMQELSMTFSNIQCSPRVEDPREAKATSAVLKVFLMHPTSATSWSSGSVSIAIRA
jgi:hypothetical protein